MPTKAETEAAATSEAGGKGSLDNAFKLVSEFFVPGGSLIIDGRLRDGGIHAAAGLLASAVIGPVGWFLAAANSYSNAVTNKHVHEHIRR